jgi:hypothetical protein
MARFIIDQAESFTRANLVKVDPRIAFGTDEQEKTKADGIPVWTAEVIIGVEGFGGQEASEVIKVRVVSPKDPSEGIPMFSPVKLHRLAVSVFDASKRDRDTGQREVTGAGVSFSCERIEAAVQPMKAAAPKA